MIRCFLVLSILLYGSVSAQLSATATTSLVWAGTVLKTIPKGYTWREMAHGKCNDAHGVSRTHLVLVSDQGIIQSSNHGWTWKVALIHHTTINDHFSDVVWDAHAKRFMATAVNREHLTYVYFKPETYETDATPVWDQGGQFTSHDNTFFAERIAASENGKIVIVEKHQNTIPLIEYCSKSTYDFINKELKNQKIDFIIDDNINSKDLNYLDIKSLKYILDIITNIPLNICDSIELIHTINKYSKKIQKNIINV